jgi:hypothetical protein
MYTIAHIADHNQRSGGHYFDRSTLKFFGQRRSDFRVKTLDDGRIVVYAHAHRGWDIKDDKPASLAVYDPATGGVYSPSDKENILEKYF